MPFRQCVEFGNLGPLDVTEFLDIVLQALGGILPGRVDELDVDLLLGLGEVLPVGLRD